MPHFARNHDISRKVVCILCLRKCNGNLTPVVIKRLHDHVQKDLDFQDQRIPEGICNSCRVNLLAVSEGGSAKQLPKLYDFTSIVLPKFLRSSPISCNCLICRIARKKTPSPKTKVGRPANPHQNEPSFSKTPPSVEKQCQRYLSVIKKGKKHICTPSTKAKNLKELFTRFPKNGEKIASSVIKNKTPSPGGTIRLSQFAGPSFPIVPGSSSKIKTENLKLLSTADMISLQQATQLSNSSTRKLASCLNRLTPKGSGVEPNFQIKLAQAGKTLAGFFHVTTQDLDCKGNSVQREVILCKDIEEFIWHVLTSRSLSPHETLVKLSMDNGGDFFKICLSIVDIREGNQKDIENQNPQFKFLDHEIQSSGVKKLFVIGIVEDISETYENIKNFLSGLKIEKVKPVVGCDLKVANILCGLQSHASKHPCCYCEIDKDNLANLGELRTFGSLRLHAQAFQSCKGNAAKNFFNSANFPLLEESDNSRVLDVIPPPEDLAFGRGLAQKNPHQALWISL